MLNSEVVMINTHIKIRNIKPDEVNIYYHSPERMMKGMTWNEFLNTEDALVNAYHVRVWEGRNTIEFGKANNTWFVIKPQILEMGVVDRTLWLANLARSCMTPSHYKKDLLNFLKTNDVKDPFLISAIFGNGWDTDKWVNPHLPVIWKGKQIPMPDDIARNLATAYILTNE